MNEHLHIDKSGSRKRLVVYLHGFRKAVTIEDSLAVAMLEIVEHCDLFLPVLPYKRLSSTTRLAQLAAEVLDQIDKFWAERIEIFGAPYEEVILIGHSTGAVLARKLFVCAHGEVVHKHCDPDSGMVTDVVETPFEEPLSGRAASPWVGHIRRVVLLAAMSRGWTVEGVKSRAQAFLWSLGALYGHLKPGQPPTIFDIRRGAPFIVQTRLQWLALMGPNSPHKPENVIVVQLLGTRDDMVSPNDNLDFVVDQSDIYFSLVPDSDHTDIIDVATRTEQDGPRVKRRESLRAALLDTPNELQKKAIARSYLNDQLPPEPDLSVKEAVFVIHGIRDLGHWTQKIAAEIKRVADTTRKSPMAMRSLTPSYGFFAMAPFLLPWVRRSKVEWLMDRYVEARAMYPNAEFSYVGHSNGTYLLARALVEYPACRVRYVVFAGSVVRSNYDWKRFLDEGRVVKVMNYVATKDWVVAGVPHGLRFLPILDLGGAGHTGFQLEDNRLKNVRYVKGAHSAGLVESQWDEIAEFVVTGEFPKQKNPDYLPDQTKFARILGKLSPLPLTVVVAGVFAFVGWLGTQAFFVESNSTGALWAVACIGTIGLVRTFLTKL